MSGPTLEDEVEAVLAESYETAFGTRPSEDWMKAIAMRVGTRGEVATLDEAGSAIGLTRERVRQVMDRLLPKLDGKSVPRLRQVAELLVERSPVPEPIGQQLAKSGMSRLGLTGEAFLNIVKLLGTSPTRLVGTDLVAVDQWLVEESDIPVMSALATASRHTSSYGMTTVEEIRQVLATPANTLDPAAIERVLKRTPSVHWAGEWLWVEKDHDGLHSNRLVNTARSILSVNSPQTVASIHEGARRMWKFRQLDILPPIGAMKSFFEQSRYFLVEGDLTHPIDPLDYHQILGAKTATMIDVLKASPYQVMDRQSLMEACTDAGISRGTSGVWTTYKEWMAGFGPNVWGLRGSSPNPAAVEEIRRAAASRRRAEPRRKKWGWTTDGQISQTMDVTTSFLSSGVMAFAPGIQSLLAGQSLAIIYNGTEAAVIKLGEDHTFCWGWHPAIKATGMLRGDVLRVTIDTAKKIGEIQVGGQELWNQASE